MGLSANMSLEEVRDFFKDDRFATEAAGCTITEAAKGYAKVEMQIKPIHLNAHGGVMGGAIFTLADFAVAIASNVGEEPSASIDMDIKFMSRCKGEKLIATATTNKSGRSIGFYSVNIEDDLGTPVAFVAATCAR